MLKAEEYLENLIVSMKNVFGHRLLYVGLQGSYLREEATENSDIDVMVLIDNLSVQDLDSYRELIFQQESYEKSCGFICGMEEFSQWNPLEICHIVHSTKDYYGTLSLLVPDYSREDIINFIKYSRVIESPKAIKAYFVCKNNIHGIMAIHTAIKALITRNFDFP